ncbi:Uncharacterised protein [Streptococcus pneumoniae]|uniref:Uncharacterized protein n=1 Tax=Streptococcus pneumoniae TaxID=1313 RepID=A0A4J2G6V0_STREE|nr:Uncharacterised protein [Streptococcus pneumoniae]CIS51202.1 Uncharacterised protein [Streptococcus pneumoniae]CIT01250.1 Uncharacterised protein [Streptococcus pneumoniae]CIT69728.1 Uncharacterised protein [Streptococcus pneumoniae]CIV36577.1 Uncharacterised protein [Streptococcus pneumoniae]
MIKDERVLELIEIIKKKKNCRKRAGRNHFLQHKYLTS